MKRYLVQRAWHYHRVEKYEDEKLFLTKKEAMKYIANKPGSYYYGHPIWRIVKLVTQ